MTLVHIGVGATGLVGYMFGWRLVEHHVNSRNLKKTTGEKVVKLQNLIFVAGLFALAVPLSAYADFIAPNLPAGSKYEIAFVTSGGTTATDPYEADYDAFVTQQAAQNPNLPQATWHAIASTYENGDVQQARQNAPFTSSIPVYNTQGQRKRPS